MKQKDTNQKRDNLFYVGVENPRESRKALLETLKSIIQMLKGYESLRSVRVEKRAAAFKLKEQLSEISRMVAKLKSEFPKPEFKEMPALKKPFIVKPEQEAEPVEPLHRRLSEMDRLEKELAEVEERLKGLS